MCAIHFSRFVHLMQLFLFDSHLIANTFTCLRLIGRDHFPFHGWRWFGKPWFRKKYCMKDESMSHVQNTSHQMTVAMWSMIFINSALSAISLTLFKEISSNIIIQATRWIVSPNYRLPCKKYVCHRKFGKNTIKQYVTLEIMLNTTIWARKHEQTRRRLLKCLIF